jgi:hypothetical protein
VPNGAKSIPRAEKRALAPGFAVRGAIEPFQALQQSGNGGEVPFAASWCCYPSLVQLARDGLDGDKARFAKFANCRTKALGSHVRRPLVSQSTADPATVLQPQALKHPHYGVAMPPTASGARHPSSVQFVRQTTMGNEAGCHKLLDGRQQSKGAGVCSLPIR